ncbi:MAG TPA: alpha-glucosidase [Terracidiphilus sp.]|nr:alpha-glucosidase [Terracidiphilus sp.]
MHWTKRIAGLAAALFFAAIALPGFAQTTPGSTAAKTGIVSSERDWWKNAVLYEIYPRSFQDSNGDGIGDLNGITSRLDYLQQLGVDAIWLSPFYPSPEVDFGYDISDYENIDPQYGTLADFDRLIAEAKKRNIRVILDMVMNHSSDQHKWFLESRSSRNNPYRDWYVWRDGKGETATDKGQPPNNWQSDFGGSAWQWDDKTRQYYYHKFYIQQPDFNWNNPKVHQAFKDIIGFWLKRGVAGFRFDAITTLFEDPQMRDDAPKLDKDGKTFLNQYGDIALDDARTNNLPEVHPVMAEMRAYADTFSSNKFPGTRVFIGETYLPSIEELDKQYGSPEHPEFQLPMDMQLGITNKMDAAAFRSKLIDVETRINGNVPLIVFDNHDNPRLDVRYGDGVHNIDIQRVISTILFTSGGASLFYYGDEIGMKTTPPTRIEDVKDPVGRVGWPKDKGRDGERTPMQWNAGPDAGFSSDSTPTWLPIPPSYRTVNVQAEKADPDSLLHWYETLIRLKKTNPALATGSNTMLDTENTKTLSWIRQSAGNPSVLVSVNFTADPQTVSLSVPGTGANLTTLLKTPGAADPVSPQAIQLGPYGVYVGELRP